MRRNDGREGAADIVLGEARPEIADGDAAGKPDRGKLDGNGRGRVAGVEDREVFVLRARDIGEVKVSSRQRILRGKRPINMGCIRFIGFGSQSRPLSEHRLRL